jgi:phosphoribosylglycinamide formyltransferase 2
LKKIFKEVKMIFSAPFKEGSTKILLLGSGELGKEVAIEAGRLGIEVVAVDRYHNAPAHLVANSSYVIDMKNKEQILEVIKEEKPTYILPEIEAINIEALFEAQELGFDVVEIYPQTQYTGRYRPSKEKWLLPPHIRHPKRP